MRGMGVRWRGIRDIRLSTCTSSGWHGTWRSGLVSLAYTDKQVSLDGVVSVSDYSGELFDALGVEQH